MPKKPSYWEFQCDGIFWNTDQDTVTNDVLDGVLEKYNTSSVLFWPFVSNLVINIG